MWATLHGSHRSHGSSVGVGREPTGQPTKALPLKLGERERRDPCGLDCEAVAFGLAHTMVLTRSEARVWSWGYNDHFQLGWADARTSPVLRNGFQKPRDCLGKASRMRK